MALKLYSLEEADIYSEEVELETTPEEGEASDAMLETEEEMREVDETSEGIDEGIEAADQLEEIQEVVEEAGEEGLDPVAAEAIRIAIEAVSSRVNANPKAIYAIYATENFESASSRKANTAIALEGIVEFIKDMWERIKAALKSLWDKVKDFWKTHVSTVGRVKKALESAKEKTKDMDIASDVFEYPAPSALIKAVGKKEIDKKVFEDKLDESKKVYDIVKKAANDALDVIKAISEKDMTKDTVFTDDFKQKFNDKFNSASTVLTETETNTLFFKKYVKMSTGIDKGKVSSDDVDVSFKIELKSKDTSNISEATVSIIKKADMVSIIDKALTNLKDVDSLAKDVDKAYAKKETIVGLINKVVKEVEKSNISDKDTVAKNVKAVSKLTNKTLTNVPKAYNVASKVTLDSAKATLILNKAFVKNMAKSDKSE